ncbi:unnamed protein product [Rotaria socialis]|uniref:Uncharacterized protein n=1 Tax=Rotaria socialis TaxID=392032 RepID=A0A820TKC0_9BILA|nr:unnamed protein product [Rotaria socialis]
MLKHLKKRLSLQENSPTFELRDEDFPPLTTSDNHSNKRWNIAQPRTTAESNFLRSSDTEKAFESINDNLAKLIDSNKRLENKVDLLSTSMKMITLDTQLHHPDEAMHRLKTWDFPTKDQKLVLPLLDEWYTRRTLNTVLEEWENVEMASLRNQKEYIKILCYNVEGWDTRAVEAIDLVNKVQASICIFTEVGELPRCMTPTADLIESHEIRLIGRNR